MKNLRLDYKRYSMRKIIITLLIGMMTVGCGKTIRLVKIEREVEEEQTSLAAEAKTNRSYLEIVKDSFYQHFYIYSALIIAVTTIGSVSYLRYYHKPKHIEEQQEDEQKKAD